MVLAHRRSRLSQIAVEVVHTKVERLAMHFPVVAHLRESNVRVSSKGLCSYLHDPVQKERAVLGVQLLVVLKDLRIAAEQLVLATQEGPNLNHKVKQRVSRVSLRTFCGEPRSDGIICGGV